MIYGLLNSQFTFSFVLILGIVLLILEVFIPTFGVFGIGGIYLLINAFLAIDNIEAPYFVMALSCIVAVVIALFLVKFIINSPSGKKLINNSQIKEKSGLNNKCNLNELEGQIGFVTNTMRPSGTIEIDGVRYDAISYGEFINEGQEIIVDKIEGSKILVKVSK